MLFYLACLLAVTAAAPTTQPHTTYDQRQDGELNIQADVQNVMLLVLLPSKKINLPFGAADLIGDLLSAKKSKNNHVLQNRADLQVLGAFVEPNSPYHVEIGESDQRSAWSSLGNEPQVIIAERKRPSTVEAQLTNELPTEASEVETSWNSASDEEFKLLGALEQCGPGRRRDPDTLMCRDELSAAELSETSSPSEISKQKEKSEQSVKSPQIVRPSEDGPSVHPVTSQEATSNSEQATTTPVLLRTPPPVKSLPPVLFPKPASFLHTSPSSDPKMQSASNEESMWVQKPVSPAAATVQANPEKVTLASTSSVSTSATQTTSSSTQPKSSTQPVSSSHPSAAPHISTPEITKSPEIEPSKVTLKSSMKFSTLHPSIRIVDLS